MHLPSAGCESFLREKFALDCVHRQPVSLFCLSVGVLFEKLILPPKMREYRTDKHITSFSNGQQAWQSAYISPRQGLAVGFLKLNSTIGSHRLPYANQSWGLPSLERLSRKQRPRLSE
jgi:hypothetical protein